METIDGPAGACRVTPLDRNAIQQVTGWPSVKSPGAEIIVLRTRAGDGGQLLPVHKNHVVAFPPPVVLVLKDALRDSHKVPSTRSFKENVVAGAVEIKLIVDLIVAVGLPVVRPALARRALPILSVKIEGVRRERL